MSKIEELDMRRLTLGLSQSRLCHQANIHPTTYMKLLGGQSKTAHSRTMSKLEKALEYFEGAAA